jgi:MFS family permease
MVSLGGTTFPWLSTEVIGLGVLALTAVVAFGFVERSASEPILPLQLFKNDVFVSTGIVALLLGMAMLGAISFLPLYFQVVKGASPTQSGLQLLPLMGGLLVTSIAAGQIVSRTGKYRIFPIVGTAIMTVGLFLLSRLTPETSSLEAAVFMFVTGIGIGLVMSVLTVAVQNAVGYSELGVATAGNTLLRNIGSSLGVAVIGTIFSTTLVGHLRTAFPHASPDQLNTSHLRGSSVAQLPPAVHAAYLDAYASSLDRALEIAAVVSIAAFIASWFIKQRPMRATVTTDGMSDAFAVPSTSDSLTEITRALGILLGRKRTRDYLQRIATEAGLDVPIGTCWVVVQLRRDPDADLASLTTQAGGSSAELARAMEDARSRGLVTIGLADGQSLHAEAPTDVVLTPAGEGVADQITGAIRARLEQMLEGWSPEQYPELVKLLNTLAAEIVPGTPALEFAAISGLKGSLGR